MQGMTRVDAASIGTTEPVRPRPLWAKSERQPYADDHPAQVQPAHVLILDDDDQMRLYLRKVLTLDGHQVHDAICGLDALNQLTAEFDMVISDVELPGIDGFEICR